MKTVPYFGPSFTELTKTRRWCYWLDVRHPEPGSTYSENRAYLVCFVVEGEPGCFPTGGGEKDPLKAPWYWNKEVCKQANQENGIDEHTAYEIVCSSMAAGRV